MNEHHHTPETPTNNAHAAEPFEVRPAPERITPDWRRFEVASNRFGERIADGIAAAIEHRHGIDNDTACAIANVLGRSLGRESALASYGRAGTGFYEELREEYLSLYHHPEATPVARELIDWLGTKIIRDNYPHASTGPAVEPFPLALKDLLVPTGIKVGGEPATVHVPGNYGSDTVADLTSLLEELSFNKDAALRAYLSLPDTNAMSGDIMEDFHSVFVGRWTGMEQALTELCEIDEKEREVIDYAADRRLYFDYITPDYEALQNDAEEAFDLVQQDGYVHVFGK